MSINVTDYTNGASFQRDKLVVTNTGVVGNLNASYLQGKTPSDFVQVGNGFGITQSSTGVIGVTGVTTNVNSSTTNITNSIVNIDTGSAIKIGNLLIQSSSNGDGILIGTV